MFLNILHKVYVFKRSDPEDIFLGAKVLSIANDPDLKGMLALVCAEFEIEMDQVSSYELCRDKIIPDDVYYNRGSWYGYDDSCSCHHPWYPSQYQYRFVISLNSV